MKRFLLAIGALLMAAPAAAHQETVAYSRLVVGENGDVEYWLKIPVEDLAETLGREGHARLNGPEVRGAEAQLFQNFAPLVSVSSRGEKCAMEQRGIDVPEDDRLYGELSFVFRCPAGAPVTLDYRVFFDVDPGHMGMLEVEGPGGKARAELISERPRWEVEPAAEGPPRVRFIEGVSALLPGSRVPRPRAVASNVALHALGGAEPLARVDELPPPAVAKSASPRKKAGRTGIWLLMGLMVVAALGGFLTLRAVRRRPA